MQSRYEKSLRLPFLPLLAALGFSGRHPSAGDVAWTQFAVPFSDVVAP
jgi:hypothetical protein